MLFLAAAFCGGAVSAQGVSTISLPPEIEYPEGVTVDADGLIYVSSAVNGAVARMHRNGEKAEIIAAPGEILPPDNEVFPAMLGMKIDELGRIWIMGGLTGQIFVIDKETGDLLATRAVSGERKALNDAVIMEDAAYLTDTVQPILWKIARDGEEIGESEAWIDFTGTPLEYGPGRNLNGIAADASGRYLIVIQMDKGLLYRIDIATRQVTPVDIGDEIVTNGDGLVISGQTMYLVRQAETEIVTLRFAPDFGSADVVSRFSDPALTWPATAAIAGDELLVADSQFNRKAAANPVKPFSLVAIPLNKLGTN